MLITKLFLLLLLAYNVKAEADPDYRFENAEEPYFYDDSPVENRDKTLGIVQPVHRIPKPVPDPILVRPLEVPITTLATTEIPLTIQPKPNPKPRIPIRPRANKPRPRPAVHSSSQNSPVINAEPPIKPSIIYPLNNNPATQPDSFLTDLPTTPTPDPSVSPDEVPERDIVNFDPPLTDPIPDNFLPLKNNPSDKLDISKEDSKIDEPILLSPPEPEFIPQPPLTAESLPAKESEINYPSQPVAPIIPEASKPILEKPEENESSMVVDKPDAEPELKPDIDIPSIIPEPESPPLTIPTKPPKEYIPHSSTEINPYNPRPKPLPVQPTPTKPTYKPSRNPIPSKPVIRPQNSPKAPVIQFDYNCKRGNGFYAIAEECDSYVECKKNIAMKYLCPDGLLFNPHTLWPEYPCAYPSEVKCQDRATRQDPQPTDECPRQYGYFLLENGDCGKYIMCQEGKATIMSCPAGLAFNLQKFSCDWPANVPSCNPDAFQGFVCPAPPLDEFNNPSELLYKYRYGKSCKEYVACQRGHPRLLSCDPGLSFDEISESCIDSDYVTNCGINF